ncbi:MAG TPA: hypothetical protein VE398_21380 [Acidobacteriota bacterium]|nr:hypothetical protein [Acidobacteriota bacterium]
MPPLILADEPTGNLNSKTGAEVIQVLRSLNERGQTIVMVTHSSEAASAAHRVVRIQDGMLQHNGNQVSQAPNGSSAESAIEAPNSREGT